MQDLKQGVVQEQPLPPGTLHELVNDDGNDQVEHDEVDAEDEGDAVDGGDDGFPAGITCHIESGAPLGALHRHTQKPLQIWDNDSSCTCWDSSVQ